MSRLARYTHALISGYALLGANTVYSLVSVPVALAYLTSPEFGLWCLMTQISGYLALVDIGMSGSVARILIDYKDHPEDGKYGSVVATSALVGLVQGVLVFAVGCGLALIAGPLLRVPAELQQQFVWLIFGQSLLLTGSFATRVLTLLLTAHQRYDVSNWSQTALAIVNLGFLWVGLVWGMGVYSSLFAQAVVALATIAVNAYWCVRLKLFPGAGQWGRPTWQRFREIFAFGWDVFLYTVGYQLITASQAILVTRVLGLDMAAVWTVCTRTYFLLSQVILRIFDYCYPALSEMLVRGESARLCRSFKSVVSVSVSLSIVAAVLFSICNQPFVAVWTHGKMGWSVLCDVVLGIILPVTVLVRVHIGLIGVTKDFRFLRFLYLCEGALFAGLSLLTMHQYGVLAMIIASLVACLAVSLPYGLWRTGQYFALGRWTAALAWCQPALQLALILVPVTLVVGWLTQSLPALYALAARASTVGLLAGLLFWRKGLDTELKAELLRRFPWHRLGWRPQRSTNE